MAKFEIAYDITMGHEGGYANNFKDTGGETFGGVARNFNPNWKGWAIVDQIKKYTPRDNYDKVMFANVELMGLVRSLYKTNYWDVNKLDYVVNQAIANELFDTAINMGVGVASRFLQRALNVTNKNQQLYPDVLIDGIVGPTTLSILNNHPNPQRLFKWLNIMQGARYLEIMEKAPAQEIFADSWLSRVGLDKT
jgi:lysozyme family protein